MGETSAGAGKIETVALIVMGVDLLTVGQENLEAVAMVKSAEAEN